jgi:pimeloyl-ACP methyl ester carboxylesterase
MSGDRDAIRLEHSIKIFYAIENANFFVMPGATHFGSYEKPDLFNLVLSDFLSKPFSKTSSVELFTGKK